MASATCRWASRERYSTGRSSAWCSARYRFRRSTTSAAATSGDGAFAPVARTHRVGFGGNSFYSLDIARMLARGGQELAPAAYSGQPPGYGQGLRLIDASDARNLRQVGYYDVTGTDPATNPSSLSWDVALRGDLIYLFELSGGIEILRLAGGPTASARLPTVREPAGRSDPLAARPVAGLTRGSLVCPVS